MQVWNKAKKAVGVATTGGLLALGAAPAANAAAAIDLTAITGAVSATDITVGVLAIGAVLAVVYSTVKAAKLVMGFLKSA